MKNKLCKFLLERVMGWRTEINAPFFDRCVICVAPHTSNWDLLFGQLFYGMLGRKAHFMMKKEWFFFPMGHLFRFMGGIPINRQKHTSVVSQMVTHFSKVPYFNLAITPEGTRQANATWRKGFYYIALQANVPIVLAAVDYRAKLISWNRVFTPTGDFDRDINEIKQYYQGFHGKHPERFITHTP